MSLRQVATQGVRWTAASSVTISVSQLLQLTVLARILAPRDYGLMAIVAIVLGVAQAYVDMGVSNAIIHRQDSTPQQLSSLYWLNVAAGGIVYVAVVAMTPAIVWIYQQPRLYALIPLAAVIFLIAPFGQQYQILLQKELKFRRLAQIESASAVIGMCVAVVAAYSRLGVYSLVVGQIAATASGCLLFVLTGLPSWRPEFRFRRSDLEGYLGFGLYQMGERTLNAFAAKTDQVLIGIMLGPVALGYYSVAWNLIIQPVSKINPILTRVAFPLFSKIQMDSDRLRRGYIFLVGSLALVNAPLLFGCAVTAPVLVPVLLGSKWLPAVPIIQILAFVGLLRTIGNPIGSLLLAKGRADLGFRWNLYAFLALIPLVYLGARLFGSEGAALSVLVLLICYVSAMYYFLIRTLLGPCLKEYLGAIFPTIAISGAMAVCVMAVRWLPIAHQFTVLLVQILVGGSVYTALSFLLQRKRLQELRAMIFGGGLSQLAS